MTTTDRRPAFYRAYDHAADIVAGVTPEQLGVATSCKQFDVAALVDHIVGAGHRAVELGHGVSPSGEEFPHVGLSNAPEELRRAGKEAEAVWSDDSTLSSTVTMPWGETYTGATLVDMYLAELTGHAWDLASATGQLDRLDADLAESGLDAARAMLKPEYRNLVEPGSPYGSEMAAPADATSWERLAAFLGRAPRP